MLDYFDNDYYMDYLSERIQPYTQILKILWFQVVVE